MYTYSFSLKSKQNENAFNHIQTIAAEKKTRQEEKKDKEVLATIIIGSQC
jgi:hypothetical protein